MTTTYPQTRTTDDLTYTTMRRAALRKLLALGWTPRSALLWSAVYANRFHTSKPADLRAPRQIPSV